MTAMNTDQWNIFIAALLLGAPLVLMAGKQIRRIALILAWLALLFSHPVLGFLTGAAIVLHRPLRWFIEGLFIGEGIRASGVVSQLSQRPLRSRRWTRTAPRGRGRRPAEYSPWPEGGDDFPENLEGGQ
jgi:hypothetical protein